MKRKSEHTGLPLFCKLVLYFLLFTCVILGILWTVQVGLFDFFYKTVTTHRMEEFQQQLKAADPEDFQELIDTMGKSDNVCTGIYSVGTASLSLTNDYHTEKSCFVHSIRDEQILYLFRLVSSRGDHSFQTTLSSEQIDKYFPDKHTQQTVILWDGNTVARFPELTMGQSSDSLLCVFLFSSGSTRYFCLMSTMLIPAGSTAQTLGVQLSAVTLLALVLSLLLSLILAQAISVPLRRLNREAALLPSGDFVAKGTKGSREIRQLEQSLQCASEEIKKTEALRKELIANVSHDLRTPLTLITGYGEMMQDMPEEITKENLQVIIDESRRLTRLVNDMLENSKLEAGTVTLNKATLELCELVKGITNRLNSFTQSKGYCLLTEGEGTYWVKADELMLGRAIYNLIVNALHHTGEDRKVSIRLKNEGTHVRLEIEDSGDGIPPQLQEKIWDRYYRIPKEEKKDAPGSGLGLSITKKILELHGFPFGVNSEEGKGSQFFILLPLSSPPTF